MTVDAWYNARQGQSLLVPGAAETDRGQCVQAADYALNEVYGQPYVWANAIDWWNKFDSFPQLKNNFNKVADGSIKKGDFVIFNQAVGSVYGHIDIAMNDGSSSNFTGADSNWGGNKTLHLVNHANKSYIIGALRPKGGNVSSSQQPSDETVIRLTFNLGLNREASVKDVSDRIANGQTVEGTLREIWNSAEHKALLTVNAGDITNMWKASGITTDPPKNYVDTWNGRLWKDFMYDLISQPEWQAAKAGVKPYSGPALYTK